MSFQPTTWTGKQQASSPKLNIRPNCPFFLMHSAFQWELVNVGGDEWEWLPSFSHLNEMAGVNGCVQTKQGVDSTHSRIKFMEQGYTILDREFGYVARYETKYGGFYYSLRFNIPKTIGDRVFWRMNEAEWNDWRRALIEEGVIDKPEDEVIDLLLKNVERRINRRITQQHVPEVKAQIDELYAVKDRMKSAYQSLMNPPKKTRKKNNA